MTKMVSNRLAGWLGLNRVDGFGSRIKFPDS
jgi:hypothetical protein